MRHNCNKSFLGKAEWSTCTVCNGRIHLSGCTSKRNKHKDCCRARHEMLYAQGHKVGLADDSRPMLGTGTGE